MDVSAIIDTLMKTVGDAPEKLGEIMKDPKGAIEEITGQTIDEGTLGDIISGVKDKIAGGEIDLSNIDLGALGGIGEMLGNSPLGGIAEGLGGLFGKK